MIRYNKFFIKNVVNVQIVEWFSFFVTKFNIRNSIC